MAQSRSFQEYVKNNLDNQMWKAIEDFLSLNDPSTLREFHVLCKLKTDIR